MPFLRPLPLALVGLAAAVASIATAQEAVRVANTATLSYTAGAERRTVSSNTVTLTAEANIKHPTSLSFRLLPQDYRMGPTKCETSPTLRFTPAAIDQATLDRSPKAAVLDPDTATAVVLESPGDNRDPARMDTATVSVASSKGGKLALPLMETGPDTGIFAGGVAARGTTTANAPCDPRLMRGARLTLSYDGGDFSLAASLSLLIDPAGVVYDSMTGALVDGAEVTLFTDDEREAEVFGDDGVSRYPSTVISGHEVIDASGRRYDFRQGHYRFPLVAPGRYHIHVKPPGGYTAPSTRDRAALAALRDPGGQPFIINDASFEGVFELSSPDPFFTDIPLDRQGDTRLLVTKTASVREASPGDFVQYRVTVANRGTLPARGVRITDILPRGLRYRLGSERGVAAPEIAPDGRTLAFAAPDIAAGGTLTLNYVVSVSPGAPPGEAVNRVLVSGSDGATGNEAAASVRLRPLLMTDGFTVIGRVTEGACGDPLAGRKGVAGIRLLLEDGTYVVTDRDGLYHLEGVRPGRHVVQLDRTTIPTSHEAVACDADTRQAGNPTSRFVEGDGGTMKRVDFQLRATGKTAAAADALPVMVADDAVAAGNRDWFAGQAPGVAMLFPGVDHNPRAPAIRVVVKHRPGQRVALTVNGAQSDPLAFDATDTDPSGALAISRWSGIPVAEGDTLLVARILDAGGATVETITRTVHAAGAPTQAVAVPGSSRLVADGVTRPLIAVRLTDRAGRPVRAGTLVPFTVEAPYQPLTDTATEQGRAQAGTAGVATARVVGDDGLAFLALHPTTQAGAVRAAVTLADEKGARTVPLSGWLAPAIKEWTVVGFGAGTLGYDVLNKHGQALPWYSRGKIVSDGQLALYAKGRVKGAWLATIAYDSDRVRDRTRGLLGTIDPDRYYTVYGDNTRQGYDAATERKLYLRLERPAFVALFGDFETGMTDSQLGRYSRTLNGAKVAWSGKSVAVTAFAARTDELYARDEIQGNGLSGPYRLSARDIVPNSDKLRIEVRDRFRSEVIVSSTAMTRHIDYDIDETAGTIRFREPVLSRDADRNPVFIVVDYETYGNSRRDVAGLRAVTRTADDRAQLGVTALHDRTAGTGDLIAVDAHARVARDTEVRGEAAVGGTRGLGGALAWLVEAEHHGAGVDLLAYARQQGLSFGLGQQNLVEAGSRKIGIDGRVAIAAGLALTGTAWRQEQFLTDATRLAADLRLEWRRRGGTAFVGTQIVEDRGIDGRDRSSRLLTLGGTQALGSAVTLSGQTQIAPGGERDSLDFPIRHQLTAAWRVAPAVRLIGGYEIADGRDFTAQTAQLGFDIAPWAGAKLTSSINQQAAAQAAVASEDGQRTFAKYGLTQSLPLSPRWTIDATLDAASTIRGRLPEGARINPFQPTASGGSLSADGNDADFTALTLGASYRAGQWSWNGRAELRAGDRSDRFGLTSNLLRALGEGRTLASTLRWFTVRQANGAVARTAAADLSLAWRPLDSRWSVLDRLQFREDRADAGFTDRNALGVPAAFGSYQASQRAINNLALNYRSGPEGAGHGWEATLYYGSKWVRGSFGADEYQGYTDAIGFELRRDLGRRFDVGVQGSVQHGWSEGTIAWSGGPTVGASPAKDVWITAGWNLAGYRDRDFAQDRYTRAGPFVTLRLKFDETSLAGTARRLGATR